MTGRIFIIFVATVLGAWLYVRFAPQKSARWHMLPDVSGVGDTREVGSFLAARRMTAPAADVLTELDKIAMATSRTRVVAGQVAEGMVTYQTRSRLWGFPDYTTVGTQGDLLVVYGRLRFGQSDLGVNKARIFAWLDALGPLTEPL